MNEATVKTIIENLGVCEADFEMCHPDLDSEDLIKAESLYGEEPADRIAQLNSQRTQLLQSRVELNDAKRELSEAAVAEKKASNLFMALGAQWGRELKIPVGGIKRFQTTFNGVPSVIVLTQPQPGVYGVSYVKLDG